MRILMGAYACEPGRGSEAGAGWEWARAAARDHAVWVLTHATNEEAVTRALLEDPALAGRFHPVFLRNPRWLRPLRRGGPTRFLYYAYWQLVTSRRAARQLHETVGFDVAHHVTYASDWLPVGVSHLRQVPFVWGPVGGASTIGDMRAAAQIGTRTRLSELTRTSALSLARWTFGRSLAQRAALMLGQSADVAIAFSPVPVTVQPNIVLPAQLSQRTLQARSPTRPRAVFAGRLLGWKGVSLALAALARPEASDWLLDVYGDGPDRARLERLAKRSSIAARVRFRGSRPRDEDLTALASADALILPSLHDAAGWSVAEAIEMGCPVVCLDVGGPATLVGPDDGVVVSRAGDVIGGLARGLEQARGLTPSGGRWSADRLPGFLDDIYRSVTNEVLAREARTP